MIALIALGLAALPFVMTLVNARLLRAPPLPSEPPAVSILIPARNEAATIARCVRAALASRGAEIDVVVLDDASTDGTADIVRQLAAADTRLRLVKAPPLPPGWNGKQHACFAASHEAAKPNLLFIDADVVLEPEAAARLALPPGIDLASGVPRQIMGTPVEYAVIPMINTLLLGYLPLGLARRDDRPALAVGCGQMMIVRADAYRHVGGHGAIRASLHDGLKLPRAFRAAGYTTDLVNGADLAACRMYAGSRALWTGFLKNATEGMAKPIALPVWTILLLGGHVLPWVMLVTSDAGAGRAVVATACLLPLAARLVQSRCCREPWVAIPLHPLGVVAMLAIQWTALSRRMLGVRTVWRGRAYRAEG